MKINYNRSGNERKGLVAKIAELTGEKPVYLKTPTYSYQIGPFNVGRYGLLTCESWTDDSARELAASLAEAGFEGEIEEPAETAAAADMEPQEGAFKAGAEEAEQSVEETESEQPEEANPSEEAEPEAASEGDGPTALSVSLPDDLTDEAFGNLEKIVASKQTLMRHAFQSDAITVKRKDGKIIFSGFTASDGDHTDAYLRYITLLTKFAKEAKRVTGKDYPVDNEKFAFRCFIIRIGMIGADYKKARKILLENLTGNSSWKNGAPGKVTAASEAPAEETEVAVNE